MQVCERRVQERLRLAERGELIRWPEDEGPRSKLDRRAVLMDVLNPPISGTIKNFKPDCGIRSVRAASCLSLSGKANRRGNQMGFDFD